MRFDNRMTKIPTSTMLSIEKDTETIIKKLFIESRPYSDILKRLLVIQTPDCLDKEYDVSQWSVKKLMDEQSIPLVPQITLSDHEELKSYVVIQCNSIMKNDSNPEFRDKLINIHVLCNFNSWMLTNYRQRIFKILGYIDGILNGSRLSGIGQLEFIGCSRADATMDGWGCFIATYMAVNGNDDQLSADTQK